MDKAAFSGTAMLVWIPGFHWYAGIVVLILMIILALQIWQALGRCKDRERKAKLIKNRRADNAKCGNLS
jgi:membrane protein implicated in regulation of membrane protease activity